MLGGGRVICYHCPPPLIALSTAHINQLFMRDVELGVWLCDVQRDTMRMPEMDALQAQPALALPTHVDRLLFFILFHYYVNICSISLYIYIQF